VTLRPREENCAPHGAGPARPEDAFRARIRNRLDAVRRVYVQLIGIPDYEGYLAHMAQNHPGEIVLSRKAFCARAIDRKYGVGGPRCC